MWSDSSTRSQIGLSGSSHVSLCDEIFKNQTQRVNISSCIQSLAEKEQLYSTKIIQQ